MPVTRSAALRLRAGTRQTPYTLSITARRNDSKTELFPSCMKSAPLLPLPASEPLLSTRPGAWSDVQPRWKTKREDNLPTGYTKPKQIRFAAVPPLEPPTPSMQLDSPSATTHPCAFSHPPSSSPDMPPPLPPSPPLVPMPEPQLRHLNSLAESFHLPCAPVYHLPPLFPPLPPFHHLEQTPPAPPPELPDLTSMSWIDSAIQRLDYHSLLDLVEGLIPTASSPHLAYLSSPDFLAFASGLEPTPSPSPMQEDLVLDSPGPSTPPSATVPLFQHVELSTSPEGRAELKVAGPSIFAVAAECARGRGYLKDLVGLGLSFDG